jgi:DNA-directed RNA polymerase specialized sigma24 family protein
MAWTYDGYEPQEIARELGIAVEAVRSSLYKARRTLVARVLEERGGTP